MSSAARAIPVSDQAAWAKRFPYGWRYVKVRRPDGTVDLQEVPLTLLDVLHPQEGDVIPEGNRHSKQRRYLANALEGKLRRRRGVRVLSDTPVDWGVPGLRNHAPDLVVFFKVKDAAAYDKVFLVGPSGGRPLLAVELTSASTRKNDVVTKVVHYHQAGVRYYLVVDHGARDGPAKLVGYVHAPGAYAPLPPDADGRLAVPEVGLRFGVKGGRVACYDLDTGKEVGDYDQVCDDLEAEAKGRKAAECKARREARARREAEGRVQELEAELRRLRGE